MKKLALIAALTVSLSALASTTSEYTTEVRWMDAQGITQFHGACPVRFGPIGVSGPLAYNVSCPSFKEAHIVVYPKTKLASIDGIPARVSYPVKDTISLFTGEGETLIFVLPDCTKDAC
jgi:hypothetical protein